MLGKDLLNKVLGQAKEIVINQIGGEIKKLIDPKVIDFLVSQDKQGFDAVLDLVLAGDLEQLLKSGDYEGIDIQELKDRIREEFKQMIQENKEDLKANWKQMMKDAADKIKLQLEEEANEYQAEEEEGYGEEGEGGYDEEVPVCDRTPIPTSERCPSGYEFDPNSGVGCVQVNCYDEAIKDAHWDYTGRCVCGTSGSMNEKPTDPNKECSFPSSCAYCPGCVYACVTFDEDCPDFSSTGFSIEE